MFDHEGGNSRPVSRLNSNQTGRCLRMLAALGAAVLIQAAALGQASDPSLEALMGQWPSKFFSAKTVGKPSVVGQHPNNPHVWIIEQRVRITKDRSSWPRFATDLRKALMKTLGPRSVKSVQWPNCKQVLKPQSDTLIGTCNRWHFAIEDPRKSGGWSAYSRVRLDQLGAGIAKYRDSDKGDMFLCLNRNVSGGWVAWMPPDQLGSLSRAFDRVPRFSVVLNDKGGNPLVEQIDVTLGEQEGRGMTLGCSTLYASGWIAGTSEPPMVVSVSPYIRLREMDWRVESRWRSFQVIGESVDVIARFQVPAAVKEQVLARAVTGSVSPSNAVAGSTAGGGGGLAPGGGGGGGGGLGPGGGGGGGLGPGRR